MFSFGGTCCPTCGLRQAHVHLGWLTGDTVFTQVSCGRCGHSSLILTYVGATKASKWFTPPAKQIPEVHESQEDHARYWDRVDKTITAIFANTPIAIASPLMRLDQAELVRKIIKQCEQCCRIFGCTRVRKLKCEHFKQAKDVGKGSVTSTVDGKQEGITMTRKQVVAKIGTMSSEKIWVDREPILGKRIRYRHFGDNQKWNDGIIAKIDDNLIFVDKA